MRVAWVTPNRPSPRTGGGSGHEFELLRQAARSHEIHLFSADLPLGRGRFDLGEMTIPAEGVRRHLRWEGPASAFDLAFRFATCWPTVEAWAQRDIVRALSAAVARHMRSHSVDLVHLTFGEIAPVAEVSAAPVALLLMDVSSRQLRREGAFAHSRRARLAFQFEMQKAARWERRWFSRVDGLACVTDVDRDVLERNLIHGVRLIPNPIPDSLFEPPTTDRSDSTVVFVANLSYRPNIDAVRWLVEEIWPLVIRRCPLARLRVVGFMPGPEVVAAVSSAGGKLHGNVDDVRPFYWGAAAALAPIRLGSGLRNKVLHAIACGAPVVATPASLEGIGARNEEHVLVASDEAGFADAVVRVLAEPAEARARADRARALLPAYRSERVMEQLSAWWEETVAGDTPEDRSAPVDQRPDAERIA